MRVTGGRFTESKPPIVRRGLPEGSRLQPLRERRVFLVALAASAILVATLIPGTARMDPLNPWCLACGDRDAADALLNVILFLPLGMTLSGTPLGWLRSMLGGMALSAGVEILQVVIPGRDPSIRDLLMNSAGLGLGLFLGLSCRTWLAPPPRLAARLAGGAAAFAIGCMALTAFAFRTEFPQALYYGQWTPVRAHQEPYRGRVLAASVGDVSVEDAPVPRWPRVRENLQAGVPLSIRIVAGPPPLAMAGLFAIADADAREVIMLGVANDDLVLRPRLRAAGLRLDDPSLRITGALHSVVAGDTASISAWRSGNGWCVQVQKDSQCGVGYSVGSGWRLLYSADGWGPLAAKAGGVLWLAGLVFPAGFWLRRGPMMVAVPVILAGATLVVGRVAGLGALDLPAVLLGLGAGVLVGRRTAPARRFSQVVLK